MPNLADFKLAGKDENTKAVYINKGVLHNIGNHKHLGLSKTDGNKFATDSDLSSAFDENETLICVDLNSLDTSNATNMHAMFNDVNRLTSLNVSSWDTSKVTNMKAMFELDRVLTSLDVSKWDTRNVRNVTDMSSMFAWTHNLTSINVSG